MRNKTKNTVKIERRFLGLSQRDFLLLCVLAILLLVASWYIFHNENNQKANASASVSETEEKVVALLEEMVGVGEARVVVCQTEEGIQSVVVVCDGAKDLQVIINVREAVAAALGTSEKAVKVYLKKD